MALDPIELVGGLAIGTGLGGAISDTVNPRLQSFKNEQWSQHTDLYPAATTLASGVAQGQIDPKLAAQWATFTGFGQEAFDALVNIANTGPPLASALTLLRRGTWTTGQYHGALNRAAIEPGWWDGLTTLRDAWLTPEELAVMVQRGVVPDPGYLPVGPPTEVGKVPPMPVAKIDTATEAAGGGADFQRMAARARIIGLPASPDLAARMTFRKIIDRVDFDRAISEGNTRNEWAPFLFEGFREIPTAEQFVQAHLRGWITRDEMYAGTRLHGMKDADADLEFQIHRRPLTPHQIKQALARGASFNPEAGEITNPYVASVHQANLGPEWYEMAESLAGSYPSVFVTNRLVNGGTITPAEGSDWLARSGLADRVVTALHDSWTGGTGGKADPHVTKAESHEWTVAQTSYINGESDAAAVEPTFTALNVPQDAQTAILASWDRTAAMRRKQLTPAQIKKGFKESAVNAETNAPWTRDEALAALIARGYPSTEADSFLNI